MEMIHADADADAKHRRYANSSPYYRIGDLNSRIYGMEKSTGGKGLTLSLYNGVAVTCRSVTLKNAYAEKSEMKSSLKCDVEICITVDGEETTETIPECLQGAFMCTADDVIYNCDNDVTLPMRYSQYVNNSTDQDKLEIAKKLESEKQSDREEDLQTALKWIKQEMMIMKEQDKVLMKKFVNLRSQIVQLRSLYDFTSSNSDLSQDGSTLSLDEIPSRPYSPQTLCTGSAALSPDLELSEFRDRTSSLLSPSRHNGAVTRIKWKSHEYI